ncbi:MAG: hypothetical protein ACUVX8_08360 [Candidatus Zipacnadales bacterium]
METYRLAWDTMTDSDLVGPNGKYFVEVTAKTVKGAQTRAFIMLRLEQ